jgi:hypothetical protein
MSDRPESRPSASGLLESLKSAFSWPDAKKAVVPVEEVAAPIPAPAEAEEAAPDWLTPPAVDEAPSQVVLAQSSADTLAHPVAAPTVVGLKLPEASIVEEPGIQEWLQAPHPLAEDSKQKTIGPFDPWPPKEIEASVPPIVSEPEKVKVEVDPFAGIKEFNGHMELICKTQEFLGRGGGLSAEERKQVLIAVAKANTLLPRLPKEILDTVILMRAVAANNPKFGREDFQREMLAVVDQVRGGGAKKA